MVILSGFDLSFLFIVGNQTHWPQILLTITMTVTPKMVFMTVYKAFHDDALNDLGCLVMLHKHDDANVQLLICIVQNSMMTTIFVWQ